MPFAGRIQAAGKTLPDIAAEVKGRLARKANQPEVLVLLSRNVSSTVTVVGEVTTSTRVPLDRRTRAAAGRARLRCRSQTARQQDDDPTHTRRARLQPAARDHHSRPKAERRPPAGGCNNSALPAIELHSSRCVRQERRNQLRDSGHIVAQALARSGGLIDSRSNPSGVFVFRLEPKGAQASGQAPAPPPTTSNHRNRDDEHDRQSGPGRLPGRSQGPAEPLLDSGFPDQG